MGWEILNLEFRNDILEDLFRCSDLESLKTFRLVCKLWNWEARRVLAKRSFIKSEKGSLMSLQSTLTSSPTPQYFFTNLQLTFTSPINQIIQTILQEFGQHLKALKTTTGQLSKYNSETGKCTNIFNLIYSLILTKWCPNLEHLSIVGNGSTTTTTCSLEPYLNFNTKEFLISTRQNLQILELHGCIISKHLKFCLLLIKSCPHLTRLRISFGWNGKDLYSDNDEGLVIKNFFTGLAKYPEITKNLKEFALVGPKVPGLMEILSNLDFSSMLKTLVISGSTNISDPQFQSSFIQLLEKVSSYLEKLKICKCSCNSCEWRNWKDKYLWKDIQNCIPIMENLKVLEISTAYAHSYTSTCAYGIGSAEILQKFPNLHTFELTNSSARRNFNGSRLYVDNNCVDYFFQDWNQDFYSPTIKKLTVNHLISRTDSINFIVEHFPNLNCLSLAIKSDIKYCWEVFMQCKFSLPTALEVLSKMTNLTELIIRVDECSLYVQKEIVRAIKVLKEFPELRRCTLILGNINSKSRYPVCDNQNSHNRRFDHKYKTISCDIPLSQPGIHISSRNLRLLNVNLEGLCCQISSSEQEEILRLFKGQ